MTTNEEQHNEEVEPNYDIALALMEYVDDMLPDAEEWEGDMNEAEREDIVARAFFICVTAWNHAALPEDCAALYLSQVESSFAEIDAPEIWEDSKDDMLAVSQDMGAEYPGSDHIIIDHELEPLEDGQMGLAIDVIPVDVAVSVLRKES